MACMPACCPWGARVADGVGTYLLCHAWSRRQVEAEEAKRKEEEAKKAAAAVR